jgi:spermidine synthase
VLGALLPGWVLLAWLGIQKGILAMAVLNLLLGLVVLFTRLARPGQHPGWRLMLPLLTVFSLVLMSSAPLDFQFPSEGESDRHETLYYREGPLATTKVYGHPGGADKHMSVDGIVIGGTGTVEFKQFLLAHLPKMLLEDVSSELSVGLGSGILAGESARHSRVQKITAVEIEPSVVAGAEFFTEENHDVLNNPKLTVVTDDIGNFLRTNRDLYQVISADEKTADEFASNGFSYSQEYYELLRDHLAPGGLVAQWVPTTLPPTQYRMILKTFTGRFPHVQLWYFLPAYKKGPFNTILIGSNEPVVVDYGRIDRYFADNPKAFESLARYGLTSADAVVPHLIADETVLRDAVESATINSLDHPRYEFFPPWAYAIANQSENVPNHDFLIGLKLLAAAELFTSLKRTTPDPDRLRQSLAAEERYLVSFRKFLDGMPASEIYREFDRILAMAPCNDSLRARIYAQYSHMAGNAANPSQRARLKQRADSLYPPN